MPTPNDRGPHRPRTNIQYHVENGWAVPDQPQTPPRRTSTQEQRRAQVLAKLNMRMPATVKMLENLVRQTVGAENVWIEEHPAEYAFTVYVQEDKLSDFLGIARRAVHDARPAHLNYKFIERLIRNARLDLYGAGYGRIIHCLLYTSDAADEL